MRTIKLGVLISGRGSNLKALIDAINNKELNAKIEFVFSNSENAEGLEYAKDNFIPYFNFPRLNLRNAASSERETRENEMTNLFQEFGDIDYLCLAGFMQILGLKFIETWKNKIINIHPSLLPAFPGLRAQKQAFQSEVKIVGATVHFVNSTLDGGNIIAQAALVNNFSSLLELEEEILKAEHLLYKFALRKLSGIHDSLLQKDKDRLLEKGILIA